MTQKRNSFRDKIGRNTQKQRESKKSFGYLDLPKDLKVLAIPEDTREIELDFLPYVVTVTNHPDKDIQYDVATKDSLWYRRPFKVHKNVGVDNETIVCPRSISKGSPCPICEHREKRAKDNAEKEELRELYGKSRSLYVVIPFGIKKFEEEPTVWDMSDFLFQDILNDEMELNESNMDFPSLEEGKTAVIKLKWKSFGKSTYPEVRSINFEKRDPYPESILKEVPNLDELLKVLSYKDIDSKFFELDDEEDGGELQEVEEDETSTRKRKSFKDDDEKEDPPKRRSRVEKEDKDLDEHKTSRRSRVAKDEEEPEKEEKPSRRSSRVKEDEETPKNKCPFGHVFGKDEGKFKDCDECDIWKSCAEGSV